MAAEAQQVMLAQKYDEKVDPTGWWMSEKLDGVRAYWSGSSFYSRNGNKFHAPAFFTADLPKTPLDGELWCGRNLFQKTISIVKKTKNVDAFADDWKYVTYLVFDAPARKEPYEKRVEYIRSVIDANKPTSYAAPVGVQKCKGREHLDRLMRDVLRKGGEGIMLRKPGSLYENKRSYALLKVKKFHSEEALVEGQEKGSGRCSDMMGKLHCVLPNGVRFKVGTGFSDAQRKNPPKVGAVIEFKFQELSNSGSPRFPVFLRVRPDITWDDVCKNAKVNVPFSHVKKVVPPLLVKQHSILFSSVPSRDQKSGSKILTEDDVDSDADDEPAPASASAGGKPVCRYGLTCFRTNKEHLDRFAHPPKPAPAPPPAKKEPCKFGAACYRRAPEHLAEYSHPPPGQPDADEEEKGPARELSDDEGDDAGDLAELKAGEWGLPGGPYDSDSDDDDTEETITIKLPKKDWEAVQKAIEIFAGLNKRVRIYSNSPSLASPPALPSSSASKRRRDSTQDDNLAPKRQQL